MHRLESSNTERPRARSLRAHALLFSLACAALLTPGIASASEVFVATLQDQWDVGSLPVPGKGCQLCHQNDDGGKRTATTPFARHLVDSYGLEPGAPAPLRAILEQNRKNGDDSDDDGDSDYDEIVICSTDPNDPSVNCAPPPTGSAGAVGTGGMPASGGAASGGVSAENGGATPDGSGGMSPAGGGSEEVATGGRRSLAPQPPSAKYGCTLTGLPRDRSGGLGPALLVALAFARSLRRPRHGSASPRASRGSQ